MFETDNKPSQNNSIKPTLRNSRDGNINEDLNESLVNKNEYDDSQYKTHNVRNDSKKTRRKSVSGRSKSKLTSKISLIPMITLENSIKY